MGTICMARQFSVVWWNFRRNLPVPVCDGVATWGVFREADREAGGDWRRRFGFAGVGRPAASRGRAAAPAAPHARFARGYIDEPRVGGALTLGSILVDGFVARS